MLRDLVVRVVLWCWRNAVPVVCVGAVLAVALGIYAFRHLGLDTDEGKLISPDLPFRQAERVYERAFPPVGGSLVVVIDATSQASADEAARLLKARLEGHTDLFHAVRLPPGTEFFARNGLLYLSLDRLRDLSDQMVAAQPLIGTLARDPSLRGLLLALDLGLQGVERGDAALADFEPVYKRLGDVAASVQEGDPRPLRWRELFGLGAGSDRPARALLLVEPVLDYSALVPGRRAAEAIRAAARHLAVATTNGPTVRLTGSAALTDDNFATVSRGVEISTPLSVVAVCALLFLAVRSKRVVLAILLGLVAGLAATAAFAAATVHTLNPISVAFAVMFVGIAVDFGIQFTIRVRAETFAAGESTGSLADGARAVVGPLALAAAATSVGFLSFVPTAYAGVAQLGLIAGAGMLIALVVNLTLLPALLSLLHPPPAAEAVALPWAAPVDHALRHQAFRVVLAAALLAVAGAALLPLLGFNFNPLDLQDPKAESVQAFRDLARDPDTSPYAIDVVAPSQQAAEALSRRLEDLPEVDHTVTLADLVPERQDEKLVVVADLGVLLGPTLSPAEMRPSPTVEDDSAAILRFLTRLRGVSGSGEGSAGRLATLLEGVLAAGPAAVASLERQVTVGLPALLDDLRRLLEPRRITRDTLPADLARQWLAPDGRARVEVIPKSRGDDFQALGRFVTAVRGLAPDAAGMPVVIYESGRVVVDSFERAGLIALAAIGLLLGLLLRNLLAATLVLLPLVLGGLYTVIGAVALGLSINFANIIALPLLLGIGVAFNIYFVVNWRHGVRNPLETATSRAVMFSALTTGAAFGSLAISPHPGTASMGLLLFLSLSLSVLTTFLVLPSIFVLLERKEPP
jgi:uncharacterized protein